MMNTDKTVTTAKSCEALCEAGSARAENVRNGFDYWHPKHLCDQCRKDMGNEWIMGPVCGKCCRANHRKAIGK